MKRLEKIAVLIICLGFVFGLALCLSACNETPIVGGSTSIGSSIKRWNKYDGVSFGYINAKDCEDGNIHEDKMKAKMQFESDNTYYMVIDFIIQAVKNNSGTDRLHTKLEITPASAIDATIQDAATSDIKEEVIDGNINISLSYKIPESSITARLMRLVIQLRPVHSSDTKIKLSFESENDLNAVKTTELDDLIVGDYTQGLEYTETADGGYAVSKGTADSDQIIIPTYKNDRYVTSIGDSAFSDCNSFTSITIPNSATSIGERAFSGCSSLTSITIPDSVTSISDNMFQKCSSLTSITIPNSATSIGESVFSGCSSLNDIIIPKTVESINRNAFEGCTNLKSINFEGTINEWIAIKKEYSYLGSNIIVHCTDGDVNT